MGPRRVRFDLLSKDRTISRYENDSYLLDNAGKYAPPETTVRIQARQEENMVTEVCTQIIKREELGSTGVGNGVALPHARLRGLTNLASSAGVRLLTRTTCGCEQVIIRLPFCRMLRAFATEALGNKRLAG